MQYITIIYIFFLSTALLSDDYIIQWNGELKYSQTIRYPNDSTYKIIQSFGFWEDNKGYYGKQNCLGWSKNFDKSETLEVNCEAIDNDGDKFWVILERDSEIGAGIGNATYLAGSGKYNKLIGKTCKYAVNYSQGGFFYKQKCKL